MRTRKMTRYQRASGLVSLNCVVVMVRLLADTVQDKADAIGSLETTQ